MYVATRYTCGAWRELQTESKVLRSPLVLGLSEIVLLAILASFVLGTIAVVIYALRSITKKND